MSFVSRLFSREPSSANEADVTGQENNISTANPANSTVTSTTSNGLPPKQSQHHSQSPLRPVNSILRQPSPLGEARNQQQQEIRRVSFSSAPVQVATIPLNPPKANENAAHHQRTGTRTFSRVPRGLNLQQPLQQYKSNSNKNSNGSWFRSFFSSPTNSNSPSLSLSNGHLPPLKSSSRCGSQGRDNGTQSSIDETYACFRPLNNTQLLENIPLELTQSFDNRQLRLTDWDHGGKSLDGEPEIALDVANNIDLIASQGQSDSSFNFLDLSSPSLPFQLAQPKPFRLDSRKVGLLMLNRDGICGFNNIKSKPLELTLKKLLVQNIMDEVPTPKTATNPLLRTRASPQAAKPFLEIPSTVTASLSAESRSKTDKSTIRGVDLNKLEIDVFYSTIAEMIFGAISIAQKPVKSMIDAEYANGAKLLAFKLHHLGTEWHDGSDAQKAENLYISSFIIDAENANPRISGLPIQCGVAILWLCPHNTNTSAFGAVSNSSNQNNNPRSAELTLYNLLFNTPGFLMNTLQLFAYDLFNMGIDNIRTCFYWMLYRLVDFMNAVRLKNDLDENETIDSLVNLIQRYDNKEHFFFISNLLSTIFSFSYKQDRFKVVLWTSQPEQLPMMSQVATLINQFMIKSCHQVSDEMVITPDYQFVIPESLRTDFEIDNTELASDANLETEFFQPVPGSSCSSTLSTVTAIQVQSGVVQTGVNQIAEPSTNNSQSQPDGLRNYCNKSDRKSRDESIGYDSLSDSAVSGNISPVNSDDDEDQRDATFKHSVNDFTTFQKIKQQRQQKQQQLQNQQQQSDALRALLNVSQTTDYEESDSSAFVRSSDTDTTVSGDESNMNSRADQVDNAGPFSQISKTQQNYFRGYVDLRYKDGQQQEETDEQENNSNKLELTSKGTSAVTGSHSSKSQVVQIECSTTTSTSTSKLDGHHQSSLPLSISFSQTLFTSPNVSHISNSSESHELAGTSLSASSSAPAAAAAAVSQMQIQSTSFNTVSLNENQTDKLSPSPHGTLSPAASALYHYSWLSLPVISCQHLDLLTTQVIFGETVQQASARRRDIERDGYPETYEYLLNRLSKKLKEEENNDTIFLVNCDTWEMYLLERALSEPCGPVMSSYLASACERVLSLATIEGRKFDVWQFIRYKLTHLMLKSEVLQSVLVHDLHLLMRNRLVRKKGDGNSSNDMLEVYINKETKEYARNVWAELMGDQTVNVYLTSDGLKAAFDLFRFRAPTSALYLFSDNNLSQFYLPSSVTTRLLDFDSSDLLVIVGMRKLFLRSREPMITAMHGQENAKTFSYLLKYPRFIKSDQCGSQTENSFNGMTSSKNKSSQLYKTIAFNMLLADVLSSQQKNMPSIETTSFSLDKEKQLKKRNCTVSVNQTMRVLQL